MAEYTLTGCAAVLFKSRLGYTVGCRADLEKPSRNAPRAYLFIDAGSRGRKGVEGKGPTYRDCSLVLDAGGVATMINSNSGTPSKAENTLSIESSKSHEDQIETWIRDARAGSSDALGALVNLCRNYLLAIANRQLPASLQAKLGASDLVQVTSLEALRSFGGFKGERLDQLLAWLRQILLHNVANVDRRFRLSPKRQVSREVSLADAMKGADHPHDSGPTPSGIASSMEIQARVEQAISRLPNNMKDVISLRNRDRLTFAEIGGRMGCSPDAARKLWARAIERLHEELVQIHDRKVP